MGFFEDFRKALSGNETPRPWGIVAEFEDEEALLKAGREMHHGLGYTKLDALTPFPVHGIEAALGIPRSILGFIVICVGLTGTMTAILLQWWTGAVDYPLVIAGKPLFAFEFAFPIMFELSVLFSAFACVFGMLALNGLPQLFHPTMKANRFGRATDDGFLLIVEKTDPKFSPVETREQLMKLGASSAEVVED
ncbi:MAG: DUF3341 domain-containing protein [Bryobacter sp.]|nr:DUF3341 domain-containing protein [Bryobacter sp.]